MAQRVVVVTGSSGGIGSAIAAAFTALGDTVVGLDLLDGFDVTDPDACAGAAARVRAEHGPPDVLCNNAGIAATGDVVASTPDEWQRVFAVNVFGVANMSRAFLPGMLKRGKGSIINMSSIASSIRGLPNRLAYGTSKAAVIGFTKAVAADYVKQGIRCNAVCPGTIDTPSLAGRINALADPAQARKDFVARQPMGRLGTVDDITPLLVYLASDESAFATGVAFPVDGGMTI